jgi:hypothetical protein
VGEIVVQGGWIDGLMKVDGCLVSSVECACSEEGGMGIPNIKPYLSIRFSMNRPLKALTNGAQHIQTDLLTRVGKHWSGGCSLMRQRKTSMTSYRISRNMIGL